MTRIEPGDITGSGFFPASRRDVARALAALFPSLIVPWLAEDAAGKAKGGGKNRGYGKSRSKKKHGKKGKGPNNHKHTRPGKNPHGSPPSPPVSPPIPPSTPQTPPPPGEPDVCDTTWPAEDQTDDRQWCKYIREQCAGGINGDFCIVEGEPTDLAKVAVCCGDAAVCCGDRCCGDSRSPGRFKCCNGQCVDTDNDTRNCGQCGNACNQKGGSRNGICQDGACVCTAPGQIWQEPCGCFDPTIYVCCPDGSACHAPTSECVLLPYPDGSPNYGCGAKGA